MTTTQQPAPLHVTTFVGKLFQMERVTTTVYALTYDYLDALEAFLNGNPIDAAFLSEFQRVGMIDAGSLTALGTAVVEALGMEVPQPPTSATGMTITVIDQRSEPTCNRAFRAELRDQSGLLGMGYANTEAEAIGNAWAGYIDRLESDLRVARERFISAFAS